MSNSWNFSGCVCDEVIIAEGVAGFGFGVYVLDGVAAGAGIYLVIGVDGCCAGENKLVRTGEFKNEGVGVDGAADLGV